MLKSFQSYRLFSESKYEWQFKVLQAMNSYTYYISLTMLYSTMGKGVLLSLHHKRPRSLSEEANLLQWQSLLWCCTSGINILSTWEDWKKVGRRAKQVTEASGVRSNVGKFVFWQFYSRQRSEWLGRQTYCYKKKEQINLLNIILSIIWLRLALVLVHTGIDGRSRAKSEESLDPNEDQNIEFTISFLTIIMETSLNQNT